LLAPQGWHAIEVILHLEEREPAEARRQRVSAAIVRNAKSALERDRKPLSYSDDFLIDGDVKHGYDLIWFAAKR
jgi:hypothetical protein